MPFFWYFKNLLRNKPQFQRFFPVNIFFRSGDRRKSLRQTGWIWWCTNNSNLNVCNCSNILFELVLSLSWGNNHFFFKWGFFSATSSFKCSNNAIKHSLLIVFDIYFDQIHFAVNFLLLLTVYTRMFLNRINRNYLWLFANIYIYE